MGKGQCDQNALCTCMKLSKNGLQSETMTAMSAALLPRLAILPHSCREVDAKTGRAISHHRTLTESETALSEVCGKIDTRVAMLTLFKDRVLGSPG